jgi:hypothetical protein
MPPGRQWQLHDPRLRDPFGHRRGSPVGQQVSATGNKLDPLRGPGYLGPPGERGAEDDGERSASGGSHTTVAPPRGALRHSKSPTLRTDRRLSSSAPWKRDGRNGAQQLADRTNLTSRPITAHRRASGMRRQTAAHRRLLIRKRSQVRVLDRPSATEPCQRRGSAR